MTTLDSIRRRLDALALLLCGLCGCGGSGTSTQEWVGQLKDREPAKRLHAVKALGEARSDRAAAVAALAEAVASDADAFVRRDAAAALGAIGSEARAAVPALVAALRDRSGPVRKSATEALKKVDPAASP
jgi:HEAT repeat protein